MTSKRTHSSDGPSQEEGEPNKKRSFVAIPPVNLGPISTEEELDIKVLKFQNAKLYSRVQEVRQQEEEVNSKVLELERLRSNDQTIISVLNRAWNQLDEDVCILLQRFEEIEEDKEEYRALGETTAAFLERLSDRTTKSMQEETDIRQSHSYNIISHLMTLIDKTVSRSKSISQLLSGKPSSSISQTVKDEAKGIALEIKKEDEEGSDTTLPSDTEEKEFKPEANTNVDIDAIELAVKDENAAVKEENQRIHALNTSLHDKYNTMSAEFAELNDKHATAQKELSELTTKSQDMEYDLQKAHHQVQKLIDRLNEIQARGVAVVPGTSKGVPLAGNAAAVAQTPSAMQDDDGKAEIDEFKELANTRLTELEKLQDLYKTSVKECEQLRLEGKNLSEDAVMQSPIYKSLQVKFTMLYNDAQLIRSHAEEARKLLTTSRGHHHVQMEQLETDASTMRKKTRMEVGQLEKLLIDTRRELELLRVEYEHNMKAHEQIGPMAKEMRHLINSLQNHNQQLKGEVMRYKRKLGEAQSQPPEDTPAAEKNLSPAVETQLTDAAELSEKEKSATPGEKEKSPSAPADTKSDETIKSLRANLKQSRESEKELKLLLDMYKLASKETREKAEMLKAEKTYIEDIEKLNAKIGELNNDILKRKQELTNDEAITKMKHAEGRAEQLEKSLANTKQEEDALLAEMEFTGQAFEEMQEQNIRLMEQLREKDDANLKLMSERIKANQLQKLICEERDALNDQLSTSSMKHHALEDVVKRLEEREKVLQSALQSIEKEASLRQQASEMHKRKAIEAGQQVQELTFRLENIQSQVDKVNETMIDKNNRLEEEAFKCRRMQEENSSLKRKLDKAKKMEYLGASDEILVEEVKMYKSKLTCPCCNTRRKDAILTKCFHVFCFECLKTRYDTRQRKCPKCNATFGNNDFHKIYM